ncbi:MAG: hypothetical protein J6T74_03535 [Clostridia bacterium]|nr:hypothetical protein [Clostridia bacterium]
MNEGVDNSRITKIISALLKRAMGYKDEEIIEEYQLEGDEMKIIKKKVTTKLIPPDLSASKLLLDYFKFEPTEKYENMTDIELDAEAERLYSEYQKIKEQNQMVGLPKKIDEE